MVIDIPANCSELYLAPFIFQHLDIENKLLNAVLAWFYF